jgi:hypothetical protein
MDGIFNFVRSDLFLSLVGGFALGAAGLALIKPATAGDVTVEAAQSISIGNTIYEAASQRP